MAAETVRKRIFHGGFDDPSAYGGHSPKGIVRKCTTAQELDLGEGGYAIAPAREVKSAITNAIRRKHPR